MMNKELLFSIIVPVFQCERTLSKSLDSVLNQSMDIYEIILIDDGSTDESGKICDVYHARYPDRIKVIHKDNEGPLMARIDGIMHAKGDYIMFLDADDSIIPETLQYINNIIVNTDADMVIYNHVRVYDNGERRVSSLPFEDKEIFEGEKIDSLRKRILVTEELNALWQKCVHRDIFKNVNKYRNYGAMVMGEDKLMSLDFLDQVQKVIFLSVPIYEYYILDSSISHTFSEKHYNDLTLVHSEVLKYAKKWNLTDCEDLCYRNKVLLGITGINYAIKDVINNKKEYSEFDQMVKYVGEDLSLWESLHRCKYMLKPKQKILCFLLKHKMSRILYYGIRFANYLKK